MSWVDLTQQATFRGVAFLVDGTEGSYGRRAALHEYPLRDKPLVEDLGRKARTGVLEGLVLGADYMPRRDALIDALEQPGAGRLVHPYLGEMTITVTEFKVRETTAEGGLARFSISYVESGELTFPNIQADTARQVDQAADAALLASQDDFADDFATDGFPAFVADSAGLQIGTALTSIEGLAASLPTLPDAAAAFGPQLAAMRGGLTGLLGAPSGLASALTGLISGLPGLMGLPVDALVLLRGLFSFGSDFLPVPGSTPSRLQQARNQSASSALVRRAAVIEAARSSSQMVFAGYDNAVTLRDELSDQLDVLAEGTTNDQVYDSLVSLR